MVIRTRIILGSSESPSFVSKEFYDAFYAYAQTMSFETYMRPTTIQYQIPRHMVVEREQPTAHAFYDIELDDQFLIPRCRRRKFLENKILKRRRRGHSFDRARIITEIVRNEYFLLVPDAHFYNTTLYHEWNVCALLFEGFVWKFNFRRVFVDPHNNSHTIWFFSHPKYQIEITTEQDFRDQEPLLKRSLYRLFPRAFRWD